MNIAFYVSGSASRLIKLFERTSYIISDTKCIVIDNKDNHSLKENITSGIDFIEFDYNSLGLEGKSRNSYLSDLLLEKFDKNKIDYCFCFGSKLLQGRLLEKYKYKIINFHPSILPMFPGERAIDKALKDNSFLLGNTAHFIDEGIDTGPIIMQSIIHSSQFNDYEDILGLQLLMIERIYKYLKRGSLVVQNNKVIIDGADYSKVTFYP